jgi:glycosyltransferase involved in cell wall biosynthesis
MTQQRGKAANLRVAMFAYCDITTDADGIYTNDNYSVFVNELAGLVGHMVFAGARADTKNPVHYRDGRSLYRRALHHDNLDVRMVGRSGGGATLGARLGSVASKAASLWKIVGEADLVYITVPHVSGLIAAALCLLRGKPYGFYVGADWVELMDHAERSGEWQHGFSSLRRRLSLFGDRLLSRRADFIIAAGDKSLNKYLTLNANSHAVVPMVNVAPQEFRFDRSALDAEQYRLVFVGALIARKNVDKILEAVAELERRHPGRVICHIVGNGPPDYTALLERLAGELGIERAVVFHGRVTDNRLLQDIYHGADIFLLPSAAEGFPRVIYEALSQGCLVAASGISTITEMLEPEEDFIAIDPDKASTMVEAIERLYGDAELVSRMRARNEDFVRERIVNSTAARQFVSVVENTPSLWRGGGI